MVRIEDEDLTPLLPLRRIFYLSLSQWGFTKFVYQVVLDVNIMFCTLISLYGNDEFYTR
jgi:hypothetical protein